MTATALRQLADRLGILSQYVDQSGRIRKTTDSAREALLAVMGFDTPSADAARGWLDELRHEDESSLVEPVRVVERDARSARRVRVRLPRGAGRATVTLTVTEETGREWTVSGDVRGSARLELPAPLPYGYHRAVVTARNANGEWTGDQSLIVVPSSCVTPAMKLSHDRVMGVVANLYSVRRENDWGVGDHSTLISLVEWAASRRAEFVGVNPLHALFNRGWDISPYAPVTRLFRNHIYIDVEAVPELAASAEARAMLAEPDVRNRLATLRAARYVDYDGIVELKERVLGALHQHFRHSATRERQKAFDAFVREREPELTRFGTWMAIATSSRMPDWRRWPVALHDPASEAVRGFRESHAEQVDFHKWLQFETHEQLRAVAERAKSAGMEIGVYQDLAIGTNGGGSDTWSNPGLFLTGASVGAPPDPYSSTGQVWGLPPLDPRALKNERYRYWIQLLRRAFEHAGALRVDHVMGLFRSFWIPDGLTGLDGAYVASPAQDLLGILALESMRHDALVVGEDLGTVPREVPPAMKKWGILSSKAMYFERDATGFRGASRYPPLALATANTHDMPPLAGFWSERDIELREEVGLLRTAEEVRHTRRERVKDKASLLRVVGLPARAAGDPGIAAQLPRTVHDFLSSTRSALVGVSLDDLMGETEPVNVPGVGQDKYPSWRRRTRMTVEEMSWSQSVDTAIGCANRRDRI